MPLETFQAPVAGYPSEASVALFGRMHWWVARLRLLGRVPPVASHRWSLAAKASRLGGKPSVPQGRALDWVGGKIVAETMRRLNNEVDGRRRDPAQVARAFLDSLGLLSPEGPRTGRPDQ